MYGSREDKALASMIGFCANQSLTFLLVLVLHRLLLYVETKRLETFKLLYKKTLRQHNGITAWLLDTLFTANNEQLAKQQSGE